VAADFVAVSYYKLFGYPTGVGALRASVGVPTNAADLDRLVDVILSVTDGGV
jgi:selenocysteine lyase/cysteine desulfurase